MSLRRVPLARRQELARTAPLEPGRPWARSVPLTGTGIARAREPKRKSAATGRGASTSGRRESFPKAVAALIDARDPWCVHCGSPFDLQRHHRRIKGDGGDPRPHTDCACNGVRICLRCHDAAHNTGSGRREAEDEGLIIPRATVEPFTLSVLVHLEDDRGGMRKFPTCDGRWADNLSEAA